MKLDDLMAACAAAPDDDEPRLVWADAVGGERGELVVVQCKLARGDVTPEQSRALRRRQRELILLPRPEWSGLSGIATKVRWRRGFAEAAAIDAGRFVDEADDIFRRAPLLRSLTATGLYTQQEATPVALPKLTKLFESRALQRLAGLFIEQASHRVETDTGQYLNEVDIATTRFLEPALEIARRLGTLGHLRAFGSKWSGSADVRGVLDNVERYWLHEDGVDSQDLVGSLPSLVALDLGHYRLFRLLTMKLPTQLRELRVRDYSVVDEAMNDLARRCPNLERLSIEGGVLRDAACLKGMQRLVSLRMTSTALVSSIDAIGSLPQLRELALVKRLERGDARKLMKVLGPQLQLLDTSDCGLAHRDFDKIVAGDVIAYPLAAYEYEPLMLADGHAPEPWWERTTVTP